MEEKLEKSPQSRFNLKYVLLICLFGFAIIVVLVLYLIISHPLITLGKSFYAFSKHDSFRVNYQTPDNKFQAGGKIFLKNEDPMEFNLSYEKIVIKLITGGKDDQNIYLNSNLLNDPLADQLVSTYYPPLLLTNTYKTTKQFAGGDYYLKINVSEIKETETKKYGLKPQEVKDVWDFYRLFKFHKVDNNFEYNGTVYKKVSVGFNKNKLLQSLEDLKDMDVDLKVSQINSLIKIVEKTNGWEEELLEFLIDKKDNKLIVILLKSPEIPQDVLKEVIDDQAKESGDLKAFYESQKEAIVKMLKKDTTGNLIDLGKIAFSEYDSVEKVSIPTKLILVSDYQKMIEEELTPMVPDMVSSLMGGGYKPKTGGGIMAGGMNMVNAVAEVICLAKVNPNISSQNAYTKVSEIAGKYSVSVSDLSTYVTKASNNQIPANEMQAIYSSVSQKCP